MLLQIRAATSTDAQPIAEMTRAAWAGKVAASSSGHHESAMLVSQQLSEGGGFVLSVNNQAAGSVRWLPLVAQPDIWEILRMGVLPEFRGSDFSRELLEAFTHHALKHAIGELRLAVRTDQPRLLDLYAGHGFQVAPDLKYTHANPSEPAPIVMRRRLSSEATER